MAEFYAFQQRYAKAEEVASAALAMRMAVQLARFNQSGRVLLMEAQITQAGELYHRAIQIGGLAKAPDRPVDPLLRIYAKVLHELDHDEEAAAVDKRVKAALIRKADFEGRCPSPVQLPVPVVICCRIKSPRGEHLCVNCGETFVTAAGYC